MKLSPFGSKKKDKKKDELDIPAILLQGDYITQEDYDSAQEAIKNTKLTEIDYLKNLGKITKDLMGQAIAEYYKVPYYDLNTNTPEREQARLIPEKIAKKYSLTLYQMDEKNVFISTDLPNQNGIVNQVSQIFSGKKIFIGYSLPEDIKATHKVYRMPLKTQFQTIIDKGERVAEKLIESILEDAALLNSSDIHLEPSSEKVRIRLRIDSVLQTVGKVEKGLYENILNWIKVKAGMRIDEHLGAQDGSIRIKLKDLQIDLRVSIIPVVDGEKVVMRILSKYVDSLTLESLGLTSPKHKRLIMNASNAPFGMILITGPTGSGKTTSIYALLRLINRPDINITTIEDPVEQRIEGINHIQVNSTTGLTFAKGLRSIVRQDPDIIFVGEIRDNETAEISVNAALTGHLLFSTFHANDAPTSIPRLIDMGIEPFLLSSTLELIIAQRLVRKLCDVCRYSTLKTQEELIEILPTAAKYFPTAEVTLYEAKGCQACGGSGYKGRSGIFEIVENTKSMKDLILTNPASQQIWAQARKDGTTSFFEDGIEKVKKGVTSLEELMRVARVTNDT